ncbi:MAG: adenylate/guanylate cyclase domain-containing protein, partial [Pseudomonadota bacterium]
MDAQTRIKKRKVPLITPIVSIAVCVIMAALVYYFPRAATGLNYKLYDFKLSLAGPPEKDPSIVHLDVDDASIHQYGQWPWDRALSGKIVERLAEMGAKAVVFDILYTAGGKSEKGNNEFFDAVKKADNVVSAFAGSISKKENEPLKLEVDRARGDALYDRSWQIGVPNRYELFKITRLGTALTPLKPLIDFSKQIGHIKATPDADGIHRRVPLFLRIEDRCVPALSLAALAVCWNLDPNIDVTLSKDSNYVVVKHGHEVMNIPVDASGMLTVNWGIMWKSFPRYYAKDVLSDEPDPSRAARYKDKVVVVGVTYTGNTDIGVTPRGVDAALSRIHSNALNTILTKSFIVVVPQFPYLAIAAVVLSVLLTLLVIRVPLKLGIVAALSVIVSAVAISISAFVHWRHEIPIVEFLIIFTPGTAAALIGRAVSIELQGAKASRALERYLSPQLLENIMESGKELDLSTKRSELTIMFVDIEGFSTISETVEVELINQLLNDFFDGATQAVFEHGGTVDKFLGDGMLAFFGDPIPLENHAKAAVRAALQMQADMKGLNAKWSRSGLPEFQQKGIRIRIGLNTGMVVAGNIG